ncbi:Arabinose operon protein AraL [compost metagenome]
MHLKSMYDFTNYLFDLDGTIYLGGEVIHGAASTIENLRRREKKILFATNTTMYTRQEVRDKLLGFGIHCMTEEIMTALSVASMYFRDHASGAKVLLFGGDAMREELEQGGITITEQAEQATHVLVGLDKSFDFDKLTIGMNAVRNGARLIGANPDPFCPTDTGAIPDTGSLVKAIETASALPAYEIVGKPSKYYAAYALQQMNGSAEASLIIGDRLDTDIVLGNRYGMYTALVLSGVDSQEGIARTGIQPDYVWSSVGVFLEEK